MTAEEILRHRPDVVILPDQPYAFAAGPPRGLPRPPVALVSGRHPEWYGPSLTEARRVLTESL